MDVTSHPEWDKISPERPVVTDGGLVDDQTHGLRSQGAEPNGLRITRAELVIRSLFDE